MSDYTGRKVIQLEEGWRDMEVSMGDKTPVCAPHLLPAPAHLPRPPADARPQEGIAKLKRILEGEEEEQFNSEQYMNLYT